MAVRYSYQLDQSERMNLAAQLRRFIKHNETLEDETGYSESAMIQVVNDWAYHGWPVDAHPQDLLKHIIMLATG